MAENKTITITLKVKEIVFDVQNKSHLISKSKRATSPSAYENASYMQASDDEPSAYQIHRSINDNFTNLKVEMGEYLSEDASTANNLIKTEVDNEDELKLAFSLPSNFNDAACDSLGDSLHDYIVGMTLCEWFAISSKDDAETYKSFAEAALVRANQALYMRERPSRPTYDDEEDEGD